MTRMIPEPHADAPAVNGAEHAAAGEPADEANAAAEAQADEGEEAPRRRRGRGRGRPRREAAEGELTPADA
jgi:hypothetical protein